MRRVEASVLVRKRVRSVWNAASKLPQWERLFSAFLGGSLRCSVIQGPSDPMGIGSVVAVMKPNGKRIAEVKVTDWLPLKNIEMVSQAPGFLSGHSVHAAIGISELDDEMTSVSFGFVLICSNRFIEFASLLLPVRILYRRRLRKVLGQIADLAE